MAAKKSKPEGYIFGRPTVYSKSFCQSLVDHMSLGLSFESFAGTINVCRDTIYDWTKKHKDFSYARSVGKMKSLYFWEKMGVEGLFTTTERDGNTSITKAINYGVWGFNMKNRFGWRDKLEVTETDPDDNDLEYKFDE
jgi:hypothetical protein